MEFIEQYNLLKSKISILDVTRDYCKYFENSSSYERANCPFCKDQTPGENFTINLTKNIFYCFACHSGGDIVSFICLTHNLSPVDALRFLSKKYDIDIGPDNEKKYSPCCDPEISTVCDRQP